MCIKYSNPAACVIVGGGGCIVVTVEAITVWKLTLVSEEARIIVLKLFKTVAVRTLALDSGAGHSVVSAFSVLSSEESKDIKGSLQHFF